jgi:hypothetical protein
MSSVRARIASIATGAVAGAGLAVFLAPRGRSPAHEPLGARARGAVDGILDAMRDAAREGRAAADEQRKELAERHLGRGRRL